MKEELVHRSEGAKMDISRANAIPANEVQRMAAVARYDILDTPPDGAFDRITALAARRFGVPIAIISIVDKDRIWFKSHHGLDADQIGRDPGLCASAILSDAPYIVLDAKIDPRTFANPLVAGDFGLRFYVGVPLVTSDDYHLGTLCVIDRDPRTVNQVQIDDLKDLSTLVMDQMELRLAARRAVAHAHLMSREIDHRVMNSLQFISGLLNMQSRSTQSEEAIDSLKSAANRVAAIARVHRNFYSHHADVVSCVDFLRRLCDDLSKIIDRPVDVRGDEGDVPTTSIQPIGLIVNELVTNAAKHGAGKIEVVYSVTDGVQTITVGDEGAGLPKDFDPASNGNGLGMRVVHSLANQLNGRLISDADSSKAGSRLMVMFPAA